MKLCPARGGDCATLVTIPRGLNRIGPKELIPRWWDATYCRSDRVLVVTGGVSRLFAAPSGKLLAEGSADRPPSCAR